MYHMNVVVVVFTGSPATGKNLLTSLAKGRARTQIHKKVLPKPGKGRNK